MNTTARIKQKGKNFEIIVDLDGALNLKKGQGSISEVLQTDKIFSDSKKGFHASESDLKECFGTIDVYEISEKIIKNGEILSTKEYRDEEREKKLKQIVELLSKNTVNPQTGNPHTPERIKSALEEAHVNIKNLPIDQQINEIVEAVNRIIPIKIETKKIKITILL